MQRREWAEQAACAGVGNDFQRSMCDNCPVMEQCQDYAILHEDYEYFGGTTYLQRRKFRDESNPKYLNLVLQSMKDGLLEPHHLVPEWLLDSLREMTGKPPLVPPTLVEFVAADLTELDLNLLEIPDRTSPSLLEPLDLF